MEQPNSLMLGETDELVMLALRGMRSPEYRQASKALFSYLLARLRQGTQEIPLEFHATVEILRRLPP